MASLVPLLMWLAVLGTPAVLAWGASHVRNAGLRQQLDSAASRAGGLAYALMQQQVANGVIPSFSLAIDQAVDHLRAAAPAATNGLPSQLLLSIVKGELGKLLAADPNTSVVKPAPGLAAPAA